MWCIAAWCITFSCRPFSCVLSILTLVASGIGRDVITDATVAPGRVGVGVVACAAEALAVDMVERIVELGEGAAELVGVRRAAGVTPGVVLVVATVRLAVPAVEDVIGRRVVGVVVVVDVEAIDALLGDRVAEGVDNGLFRLEVVSAPELEATLLVALARALFAATVDRDGVEGDLRTVEVVVGLGLRRLAVVVVVVVGRAVVVVVGRAVVVVVVVGRAVGVVREAVEEVVEAPLKVVGIAGLVLVVVELAEVVAGGVFVMVVGFALEVSVEGFIMVLVSGFFAATVGFEMVGLGGFEVEEVESLISAAGKRTIAGGGVVWLASDGVEAEAMDRVEAVGLAFVASEGGASAIAVTELTALMLTVAVLVSLIRVRSGMWWACDVFLSGWNRNVE